MQQKESSNRISKSNYKNYTQPKITKENQQRIKPISSVEVSDAEDIIIVEFSIIFIEILQRPNKKNVIFEKIITPRFISIFVSASAVILVSIFAAKTTTKTMKPVRQKLINEVRAKTDFYRVIL